MRLPDSLHGRGTHLLSEGHRPHAPPRTAFRLGSKVASRFAVIVGLRPRLGALWASAKAPHSANRLRHRMTVGRLVFRSLAIQRFASPLSAFRTMRARRMIFDGAAPGEIQPSSVRHCSTEMGSASGMLHMVKPVWVGSLGIVKIFLRQRRAGPARVVADPAWEAISQYLQILRVEEGSRPAPSSAPGVGFSTLLFHAFSCLFSSRRSDARGRAGSSDTAGQGYRAVVPDRCAGRTPATCLKSRWRGRTLPRVMVSR